MSKKVTKSADEEIDLGITGGQVVAGNSNANLSSAFETLTKKDVDNSNPKTIRAFENQSKAAMTVTVSGAALNEITAAERALAEFLEVDLTASAEVLLFRVRENSRVLLIEEIRMGLRLIALKEQVEHGGFLPALAEIDVAERAAQQAMKTARAFAAEGDARRRQQLLDMGKSKGSALLAAKPEVREQIMDDADLSREVQEASFMELQRLLKDKETQIDRHQKAYADLEERLEGKDLELRKLSRVDPAALLTRSIRAEAVAEAAAIQECCDNLARLWESAITEQAKTEAEQDMRQRAVALAVSAGMAHLQAIYDRLKDDSGDSLPLAPGVMDDLTQEERQRAVECVERVRMQFTLRREQRREEAYTEHLSDGGQKKRGRPEKKQGAK